MSSRSPRHNFLSQSGDDDRDENLIVINRTAYKPSPQGARVHGSLKRTRIMRGGLGSGKTRCATEHVNSLALAYPGSLHFIGRKDITSLKMTTQREFLENVVVPETIQTFNVNDNILYYKNSSIVLFRETKEPDKVKSLELTSYMLDETDENDTNEIWEKLDDRLRQKIRTPDGRMIIPPYAGLLVFNPTHEEHWLYDLAQRKDIDLEDFRFDTEDNAANLPPDYIPNLKRKLAPWDIDRLVHGHWGRSIKGKPVYHGFGMDTHVRDLRVREDLPLLVGWDFGYNHPALSFVQLDPVSGRYMKLREYMGKQQKLFEVVTEFKRIRRELCGPNFPTLHFGDPHGADEKDQGESSIDYLRIHHGIHVTHRRDRIRTGMEEIQEKILTKSPMYEDQPEKLEPHFLIDRSCRISISAYMGGYHRGDDGIPVKDGYYDHIPDTDRYIIVNNMNRVLAHRFRRQPKYVPRNRTTGY